jgi:hypothetical protein
MNSFIFGVDDNITPLCLATELTNDSAIKIATLLLTSIPDLKLIKCENYNETGYNSDIDGLVYVAIRKNNFEILKLLNAMNFDLIAFNDRIKIKFKNSNYFKELKSVCKLKDLCRIKIRSLNGTLEQSSCLYKPVNCFETNCSLIPSPRLFLKRFNSLKLPISIINYLNFNQI